MHEETCVLVIFGAERCEQVRLCVTTNLNNCVRGWGGREGEPEGLVDCLLTPKPCLGTVYAVDVSEGGVNRGEEV